MKFLISSQKVGHSSPQIPNPCGDPRSTLVKVIAGCEIPAVLLKAMQVDRNIFWCTKLPQKHQSFLPSREVTQLEIDGIFFSMVLLIDSMPRIPTPLFFWLYHRLDFALPDSAHCRLIPKADEDNGLLVSEVFIDCSTCDTLSSL